MARIIPEEALGGLLRAIDSWGDRGTAAKIAGSTRPAIPLRRVRRWLDILVRQKRVVRVGESTATRYKLVPTTGTGGDAGQYGDSDGGIAGADGDAAAIRQLLRRPATDRPPVAFPRVLLDAYCPNESRLLPVDVRARLAAKLAADATPPGPETDARRRSLVWALVSRSRAVEQRLRLAPRPHGRPMLDVAALTLLQRQDVPQLQGVIRRLWNHRAAFELLRARGAAVALNQETIASVYAELTRPPVPSPDARTGVTPKPRRGVPLFRSGPLGLAATSYRPTADAIVLGACFRQVLGTAAVITDPIEQAFAVFAHLLLVLPFGAENVSMAALLANVPLLRAGLAPAVFVGENPDEMVTALAAWWELGRPELLANGVA